MIRLLTVIGHGIELLPHFINHYKDQVDEIQIVVYQSDLFPNLRSDVRDIICEYDNIRIVKTLTERKFDWEKVTSLYNEVKSKYPNDWWIIADIDEFHIYPIKDLKIFIYTIIEKNGWDLVRGGFIDRIGDDGNFPEILPDKSIFEQFPQMGFFRYPMSNACPNKICIMKGYVEITNGQHYAKIDGHTTWRWQGWNHPLIAPYDKYSVQVHHFKWDKSCIDRIKAVAEIKQDYSYSNEYQLMYDKLKTCNFKIDIHNKEYMFELSKGIPIFEEYSNWNKLIKKIVSI